MATLAERVQVALEPLAAGGAWFLHNTLEPPTWPYIVWLRAPSPSNNTLDGPSDLQNTRLQVDVHGRDAGELASLESAVQAAISAAGLNAIPITSFDASEPEVRAYRRVLEFSVWFKG